MCVACPPRAISKNCVRYRGNVFLLFRVLLNSNTIKCHLVAPNAFFSRWKKYCRVFFVRKNVRIEGMIIVRAHYFKRIYIPMYIKYNILTVVGHYVRLPLMMITSSWVNVRKGLYLYDVGQGS